MIEELTIDHTYFSTMDMWDDMIKHIKYLSSVHKQTIRFFFITKSGEKILIEEFSPERKIHKS